MSVGIFVRGKEVLPGKVQGVFLKARFGPTLGCRKELLAGCLVLLRLGEVLRFPEQILGDPFIWPVAKGVSGRPVHVRRIQVFKVEAVVFFGSRVNDRCDHGLLGDFLGDERDQAKPVAPDCHAGILEAESLPQRKKTPTLFVVPTEIGATGRRRALVGFGERAAAAGDHRETGKNSNDPQSVQFGPGHPCPLSC